MKKYLIFLTFVFFIIPITIFAHQPNYIGNEVEIINTEPDISKAYYGELTGLEAVYQIYVTSALKLYVQILSPKIEGSEKDFLVLITDDKENIVANLSTSTEGWQSWYEEYGGDWYWRGPSFSEVVPAGTYNIIISNRNNIGKYSLAIGETESFPISKFINTIQQLYSVKTKFFNEPWYGIFYGVIGRYLLFSSIILIIIVCFFIYYAKQYIKRG